MAGTIAVHEKPSNKNNKMRIWASKSSQARKSTFREVRCLSILLAVVVFSEIWTSVAPTYATEHEELYFDRSIPQATDNTSRCVEIQAKILKTGRFEPGDMPADPTARAKWVRDGELIRKLPVPSLAAETVIKAIQQSLGNWRGRQKRVEPGFGPECLRSLDLVRKALIVVTITLADEYECDQQQVCSLPCTIIYTICNELECHAQKMSNFGIDPSAENLSDAAESAFKTAVSWLR
jgi:hypothetical protein